MSAGVGAPVILGGMVLSLEGRKVENTGADLVTNNIEDALDAISGDDAEAGGVDVLLLSARLAQ